MGRKKSDAWRWYHEAVSVPFYSYRWKHVTEKHAVQILLNPSHDDYQMALTY
jgi:hypothetical protein